MKIRKCNVIVDQFFDVNECKDVDSIAVNAYYNRSLPEAYRILADYVERHPNGYVEASADCYYYESNGHEYCIYIEPDYQADEEA